jgi:hypothetical protein
MKLITSPEPLPTERVNGIIPNSYFLGGSIEMGSAIDWQKQLVTSNFFQVYPGYILNPRRNNWDSSWKQSIDNPMFVEQVEWELNALDACETIIMYFAPNTKSPISLLELGLYAITGKLKVCCPEGFWRKGNVDIVCKRYNIELITEQEFFMTSAHPWVFGKGNA